MQRGDITDIIIPHKTHYPVIMGDDDDDLIDCQIKAIKLNKYSEAGWQTFVMIFVVALVIFSFFAGIEIGQIEMKQKAINANAGAFVKQPDGEQKFEFFQKAP